MRSKLFLLLSLLLTLPVSAEFLQGDALIARAKQFASDQGAVDWNYPDPEIGRGVNWNFG